MSLPFASIRAAESNADLRRAAVVAEAKSWLNTPFHHMGRIRGAGVDCLMLLAEVYEAGGIAPHVEPGYYPPDWYQHRDEERYLAGLLCHVAEVPGPPERLPRPGDIVVMRMGRTFSHGAIVIQWPRLIHAYHNARAVVYGDAGNVPFRGRELRFFDPFATGGAACCA